MESIHSIEFVSVSDHIARWFDVLAQTAERIQIWFRRWPLGSDMFKASEHACRGRKFWVRMGGRFARGLASSNDKGGASKSLLFSEEIHLQVLAIASRLLRVSLSLGFWLFFLCSQIDLFSVWDFSCSCRFSVWRVCVRWWWCPMGSQYWIRRQNAKTCSQHSFCDSWFPFVTTSLLCEFQNWNVSVCTNKERWLFGTWTDRWRFKWVDKHLETLHNLQKNKFNWSWPGKEHLMRCRRPSERLGTKWNDFKEMEFWLNIIVIHFFDDLQFIVEFQYPKWKRKRIKTLKSKLIWKFLFVPSGKIHFLLPIIRENIPENVWFLSVDQHHHLSLTHRN